ncbi:heterokaryon incompatibility protein-domain-containing protein [Cadophora sp. MPI-SDFR-AT-0126]|nr:heterokaryon incompatibility protein-domain-containing protein [Leotiomycetes sp. MPI-SDFR-AT-0126]
MGTSSSRFDYGSSLLGRKIRTLKIEAGASTDIISVTLTEIPLDRGIEYTTLSYVWGDQRDRHPILCNGEQFDVGDNLHSLLVHLRDFGHDENAHPIWIDAICINQNDKTEKTRQVRMMSDIYSQAAYTYIWMGNSGSVEEQRELMDTIKLLGKMAGIVEMAVEKDEDPLDYMYAYVEHHCKEEKVNWHDTWEKIWAVFHNEWFSRVWVIQEHILSARSLVMFGQNVASSDFLFCVASLLQSTTSWGFVMAPCARKLKGMRPLIFNANAFPMIEARREATTAKLHELVHDTITFEATDERDRVFALVSLASDVAPDFIDYSFDIREIHMNLARNALSAARKGDFSALDFLSYVRYDPEDQQGPITPKLPSWAPNLVYFTPFVSTSFFPLCEPHPTYQQGMPGMELKIVFNADESLSIQGLIVDEISNTITREPYSELLAMCGTPDIYSLVVKRILSWDSEAYALASSLSPYPTEETTDLALVSVLGFQTFENKEEAVAGCMEYAIFKELLKRLPEVRSAPMSASGPHGGSVSRMMAEITGLFGDQRTSSSSNNDEFIDNLFGQCRKFVERFDRYSKGRILCTTSKGYLGWVPEKAKPGDQIAGFRWCKRPFVLRPWKDGYHVLGDSFIHGFMDNQILRMVRDKSMGIKLY